VPFSEKKFTQIVQELCEKNKYANATVRTVITGGETKDGVHFRGNTQGVFITTAPFHALPKKIYEAGVVLETLEHQRDFPHAKTTNYIAAIKWHNAPRIKQVFDALYVYEGKVLEATTSNFFIVKGNTIITPKKNVLHGITRNVVIALAKKTYRVVERDITLREVRGADEAFLTATNKDIVPVVMIDGKKIGIGKPGRRTKALMHAFADYVKSTK
ncbi:MAG: aminotransferase class IV, partial [Candidatus Azambacteria bacterium]|nr:aminotransferase class IV [Candidatus Azambacteria bacterium]